MEIKPLNVFVPYHKEIGAVLSQKPAPLVHETFSRSNNPPQNEGR